MDIVEPQCIQIGIPIREFEHLQPHEIRTIFNAYKKREQLEDYKKSYFLSWLVNLQIAKGKKISPDDIFNPLHPEIKEERANKARENAISDHDDILNTFRDELLKDKYLNENIRKELLKKR